MKYVFMYLFKVLEIHLDYILQDRQAHNLKVVGSNPTPATNLFNKIKNLYHPQRIRFLGFFVIILSVCTNHYTNRSSGFFHFNDHNSHCLYFLACFISSILYSSDELQLFPNFKK